MDPCLRWPMLRILTSATAANFLHHLLLSPFFMTLSSLYAAYSRRKLSSSGITVNKLTRHFFWIDPSSAKFEIPRAESTAASRFSPSEPERSYNMSYYDNPQSQWSSSTQNNWEHQGSTTPVRAGTPGGKIPRNGSFINPPARSGASGPQPQDDYAFSYQFDGM